MDIGVHGNKKRPICLSERVSIGEQMKNEKRASFEERRTRRSAIGEEYDIDNCPNYRILSNRGRMIFLRRFFPFVNRQNGRKRLFNCDSVQ